MSKLKELDKELGKDWEWHTEYNGERLIIWFNDRSPRVIELNKRKLEIINKILSINNF